ncbi:hypothetical protein HHK36_027194 [Tetracentron sinense]|uniref:Uncharacterized protein n=1 Tax=Tetracentron sinense TaxID=13715 RepID=A0A835D661_TETSI|nr:hypothetical protein HHK36_027194 [Tetracentron sinense]
MVPRKAITYFGASCVEWCLQLEGNRWYSSDSSAPYGSGGVSVLLASQGIAPPVPLLSLPLSSPFLCSYRVHYLAYHVLHTVYNPVAYIDFMNNMGHCNIELVPKRLFHMLPPLKYLMYTPSFVSLADITCSHACQSMGITDSPILIIDGPDPSMMGLRCGDGAGIVPNSTFMRPIPNRINGDSDAQG